MAKVLLDRITVDYGSVVALKEMSVESRDGEFLVFLGPAGAGKTTTLKVVAGLVRPTRGRVYFDGRDVTDIPANQRNVAMTFEDYALYPTMSVGENVANPLKAPGRRMSAGAAEGKVHSVAAMLQIEKLLDRRVDQLSGGQKQRVSLARSMVREPQVFLFDEPLSHVDAKIRHNMRAELHRLAGTLATTTLYVTHDYVEALSLGDRIVVIDQGEVQQIGTPREIYYSPANDFVARVVGQPNINLYDMLVEQGPGGVCVRDPQHPDFGWMPPADAQAVLGRFVGEQVRVGLRPQDIGVSRTPQSGTVVRCQVELFELWGRRGMVMTSIAGRPMRVLTPDDTPVPLQSDIWVDVTGKTVYLFDRHGRRLA